MFKKPTKTPSSHPPLEDGYTRVIIEEIKASTDKATLFILEGSEQFWIPNSQFKIRYARTIPIKQIDANNVVDIKNWFYDKEIK